MAAERRGASVLGMDFPWMHGIAPKERGAAERAIAPRVLARAASQGHDAQGGGAKMAAFQGRGLPFLEHAGDWPQ